METIVPAGSAGRFVDSSARGATSSRRARPTGSLPPDDAARSPAHEGRRRWEIFPTVVEISVSPMPLASSLASLLVSPPIAMAVPDPDKRAPFGVGGVAEYSRVAEQLHRSEAMLKRAQAIAHVGSFEANPPVWRRPMEWSDELFRIAGRDPSRGPPSLREAIAYVHPTDRPIVADHIRRARARGESVSVECRVRAAQGALRFVHIVAEAETGDGDGIEGWVGVVHDVTDRWRLEHEIRQAQKLEAVGALTSGIAHDYNNLLMGIIGCIDLAQRHTDPASTAVPYLEEARKAAREGASLTRQLLTFAKPREEIATSIDLDATIERNVKMMQSVLGEPVRLVIALDSGKRRIRMDASQAEQILMNLVVNARDAMPGGGTLTMRTDTLMLDARGARPLRLPPGAYVRLRVSDTGVGMQREVINRIFEPFFSTKESARGTGLGLSVVYGLVQRSGGHIGVQSAPGKGTTFTMLFPRTKSTTEMPMLTSEAPVAAAAHRTCRTILVVEDDPLVRLTVRSYLEPRGYRVLEAEDAASGARVLRRSDPHIDLVVSDVVLPGGSGAELLRHAAAVPGHCSVIFMSAHPREALESSGRIPMGSRAILKPFTQEELLAAIAAVMGSHR
jgi:two-component system, cell cycle sensor histidine kinase and response regulator CckA